MVESRYLLCLTEPYTPILSTLTVIYCDHVLCPGGWPIWTTIIRSLALWLIARLSQKGNCWPILKREKRNRLWYVSPDFQPWGPLWTALSKFLCFHNLLISPSLSCFSLKVEESGYYSLQVRNSLTWHYLHFMQNKSMLQGAAQCLIGGLAASLPSTH